MGANLVKHQFVYDSLIPICSVITPMLSTFPIMQQIFPKSDCNSVILELFLSIWIIPEQVIISIFGW